MTESPEISPLRGGAAHPDLPPVNNGSKKDTGFFVHMLELRRRVTVSSVAVVLCSGGAYAFAKPIAHFFMAPLFVAYPDLAGLVYTNLTEAFFAYLKLSILVGIIAYFVVLPELLKFLMGFVRGNLAPMPKFGAYLTFVARIALGFGIAFEIPFLMVAAVKAGLVGKKHFHQKRVFFYLLIFGLSFLLTVGEPVSTVLVALPLCGLYELGALISRWA